MKTILLTLSLILDVSATIAIAGAAPAPRDRALEARLNLARQHREKGEFLAAREQYRLALGMPNISARDKLDALLQSGNSALAAGQFQEARADFERIRTAADAPAPFRSYSALRIAHSLVIEKDFSAAQAEYKRIAAVQEYPEHLRQEATECATELARLGKGLPARDPSSTRTQLPQRPPPAVEFFVAPDGVDTNPGTPPLPFASLEQARTAVRALKKNGVLPSGGVAVTLRPGEHRRREPFQLTAEDSGTAEAPVVYRAETKGNVRLTGGVRLAAFKPVQDPGVLPRLPEEARGKVLQADLKAQGITDFGEMRKRGFGASPSPVTELFFNGKAMPLARWPNQGFVKTGKVLDPGSAPSARGAVFQYAGERPARWRQARDAWLFGYWQYLWADGTLPVGSIDASLRQIQTAQRYTYGGGVKADMPYYVFNLLEEIDRPGEWYLDRSTGLLYFWPPSAPAQAVIELSLRSGPMVELNGVSHVRLEGLVMELGRFNGVVVRGGEHCLVLGCTLRKLGGDGVIIDGGFRHGVLSSDLYELGRGGTRISGGNRESLTPGEHFIENCHVHDFSRVDRTYTPAVWMDGVGHRIRHNLFHDTPCHAIRLEGNDHLLEFNDIHHVLLETDDQGGLDMHYNPTYRGNVIRYNFWHDIGSGGVPCGQAGVRLDDAISGVLVYGNVFHRCSHTLFGGVQIHGGKDNIIDNNLFVDCAFAVSFSLWSNERWQTFLGEASKRSGFCASPLHQTRYPALARLGENPFVNSVWRNLVYRCGGFLTRDRGIQDVMDNFLTAQDPGFVDDARQNFALKADARITDQFGFRPIPFQEIGLYLDEMRRVLPTKPARQ